MANRVNKKAVALEEEHNKLIGYVEEYLDATQDARDLSQKCRNYYDGYQWTADEQEKLRARKQPCITNNRIKPKVQFLRGMEIQTRTDPKAYPRNPEDDQSAEVSTDALRYIADNNRSDQKFSRGFQYYLVEGTEAHEIIVDFNGEGFDIVHNVVPWDRTWWDPHSREEDFSDARWKGTLQWMDKAEVLEKFPNAPETVLVVDSDGTGSGNAYEDTHEDRPAFWVDNKRQRIRVFFAYYLKNAVWNYAIFTKSGFLQEPKPSPYLDEHGKPEPQFEFQSAFVDIDGERYGEVASYLDLQDEVNKRRSKALHLISVRQTFGTKGATGGDTQSIKNELAKPDGHAEFITGEFGKDFGVLPTGDMAAGQFSLLQESKQEIDAAGPNAALAGTEQRLLSGRAVQSLQQGGSVEIGPLFDGHRYLKNRVYRMFFNRIKQFWNEPKWIRVTDNEENLKFTGINRPIKLGDDIRERFEEEGIQALTPEEIVMVETNDPRLNEVIRVDNPTNELDVDIVLDEMLDTVTIQQEQFEELVKLYTANPGGVPWEMVIKASQLRNKDEILKLTQGGTEEEKAAMAQAQAQAEAEQREIIKASAIAGIEKDKASAAKDIANTNKLNMEAEQIAVETAIDVQEATAPRIQTF